MKTIRVLARSLVHPRISQSFRLPAEYGRYARRCSFACEGGRDNCGCGWPVLRTEWDALFGISVHAEWANDWDNLGRNNIVIVVEPNRDEVNSHA